MLFIKLFLPKIKIVYEVHRQVNSPLGKYCEKQLIKKGIKIITISQALKDLYLKEYKALSEDNVCVVHDAVDLAKFDIEVDQKEARKLSNIISDRPIVMYLGSLWTVKGVDTLLQAAEKLPEYDFYLLGKEHEDFKDLKRQYQKLDNVFILGPVTHDKVAILQKAADLLVIPHPENSLSQSPMKLFEYLASGVPILSADLANIREVLPDRNLFFNASDSIDLEDKIKYYFANQQKYLLQAKENTKIATQYSWEKRSQLIKDFINK